MSTLRLTAAAAVACAIVTLAGCAHPKAKAPVEMTSAQVIRPPHEVDVGDEIRKACKIEEPQRTPKFDYDSSDLTPADRDVLAQVARCLISGPLKGRHIELVGRADPRGTEQYNFVLGAQRAHKVQQVKLVPLAQRAHKALLVQLVHQEQQVHKGRQELG
jgi:outer membrane protein OmpA-like peptidoglycan-associated protein